MTAVNPYVSRTPATQPILMKLWSERFQPTGSTDARVSKRAIGKSHISFWSLFLRESLQNSWDARCDRSHGGIDFIVAASTMDAPSMRTLRDRIITDFTRDPETSARFRRAFSAESLPVLTVTDRHTRGLGGPVRADVADPTAGDTNFVDFVRNIGRATAKGYGGGTYGLGKGVLFTASDVSTCVVYTQTRVDGKIQPRLIAMCVSDDSFTHEGVRYTGRHWWGTRVDEVIDPLVGDTARSLAVELGLTPLDVDETGTSVTVLAPNLGHPNELEEDVDEVDDVIDTLDEVIRVIAHAAQKWAWPHMIDLGSGPTINFSFMVDGEEIVVPDPASDPRYKDYVSAYRQVAQQQNAERPEFAFPVAGTAIAAERYAGHKHFGNLAFIAEDRTLLGGGDGDSLVALLREPRFIVKYLPVPDTTRYRIRGVFLADQEHDQTFAESEPVAHDDWNPQNLQLPKGSRNPVKQTLDKIRTEFRKRASDDSAVATASSISGVSAVARELGGVISGAPGFGAELLADPRGFESPAGRGAARGGAGGGSSNGEADAGGATDRPQRAPRTYRVTLDDAPELYYRDGAVELEYRITVNVGSGFDASGTTLVAEPYVVLDDGRVEKEAPLGAAVPVVKGWFVDGVAISTNSRVPLERVSNTTAVIIVLPPADTAVTMNVGEDPR